MISDFNRPSYGRSLECFEFCSVRGIGCGELAKLDLNERSRRVANSFNIDDTTRIRDFRFTGRVWRVVGQ